MRPEIFSIGPFTLHSFGFVVVLGVLAALFLMTQAARRYGFPPEDKVFDLVFVVIFSGFFGARFFYIVQEWSWYQNHFFEIFQIWKGGLVYYGGMITSFTALFIYLLSTRLPLLATTDFLIVYVPLVHAFGRLGCFFNGCCYGKTCRLPWAVQFPDLPGPVHPVQIYELFYNLILFGFLVRFYPGRRFSGQIISLYLILYAAGRFFLEYFRGGQNPWLFSLTLHQILSLVFIFLGSALYGIRRPSR